MARELVTSAPLHPAARDRVECYLAVCASELSGAVRDRHAVLTELRDGLIESLAAHEAAGLSPVRAADAAVADFGDPAALAEGFAAELACAHARRVALSLVGTGPIVGGLWATALFASPAGHGVGLPPWRHGLTGVWMAFPFVALIVVAFGLTALVVLASTGRLSRWLPCRSRLAPTAAVTATLICLSCDVTILGVLAGQAFAAPHSLAWAPVGVAVGASLTRLVITSRATRQCLALRAGLA